MKKFLIALIILLIGSLGYLFTKSNKVSNINTNLSKPNIKSDMKIISSAFEHNQNIPSKYTCDGENVNPPLQFIDILQTAKSLVLIVDDPDAPMGTWVHWIVYNINPKTTGVEENSLISTGVQGNTSFGKPGYGGPCPPSGTHRYFFKLYALDIVLNLTSSVGKREVEEAINNHTLQESELVGLYSRSK